MSIVNNDIGGFLQPVIYIVDDEKFHRDYNRMILDVLGHSIKTYEGVNEFIKDCPAEPIGCVVTDVLMAGLSGVKLQEMLIEKDIDIPLIFVTGYADLNMAKKALKQGAYDFVEKPINAEELVEITQRAVARSVKDFQKNRNSKKIKETLNLLTRREMQVLQLMLEGFPTKIISQHLNISQRTIDSHRTNILRKFCVESFTELTCLLLKNSDFDL